MTDSQRLITDLVAAGWNIADRGRGYTRLFWPGLREHTTLFVPTDQSAPDFPDLWQAALGELEDAVATGVKAAHALAGQVAPYAGRVQGRLNRQVGP